MPGNASQQKPKLGLFAWFGIHMPFAERMRLIRAAGFDATALWWEVEEEPRRTLVHGMPGYARDAGLYVDNAHVPYSCCNGFWSPDAAVRRETVDRHIAWLHDIAAHDIPAMVMHLTRGTEMPLPTGEAIEELNRLVLAAEEARITLAIENTRSPAHLDAVFEAFDSPHVAFCYDTGHDRLYGVPSLELLRRWGHRLAHLHIADTDGVLDRHWLPGKGVIEWDALAAAYPWRKYEGVFLLEAVPQEKTQPPEAFLAEAYATIQKIRERFVS